MFNLKSFINSMVKIKVKKAIIRLKKVEKEPQSSQSQERQINKNKDRREWLKRKKEKH